MLILATLSGIQDYLLEVHETGGGQSRALRARSFRIQMISECVALQLLEALKLPPLRILLRAAAKVVIDAGNLDCEARRRLESTARDLQQWLRDHTQSRLRLAFAVSDAPGSVAAQYRDAHSRLAQSKLSTWRDLAVGPEGWRSDQLVVADLPDRDVEAARDKAVGRALTSARHLHFLPARSTPPASGPVTFEAAGLHIQLGADRQAPAGALHSEPVDRFMFHIPTKDKGEPLEFVELAERSLGAPMLGVLKADADSLGRAAAARLQDAPDLRSLCEFSNRLNDFFGKALKQELSGGSGRDSPWKNLYTVFSGGDDLLLVGPWNVAIDFASHIRRLFHERFGREGLTISAGVAIVKPKFPIRLAARQAEQLLDRAKGEPAVRATVPKDQFATLGGIWKWEHHDAIIASGKQLAGWVDAKAIKPGWLHTLLELALLRRDEAGPEYAGAHPAAATSRLAYHVARIWPRPDDRDEHKRGARAWVDAVLGEFDRPENTAHMPTTHLPAVLRYAILATRASTAEDTA